VNRDHKDILARSDELDLRLEDAGLVPVGTGLVRSVNRARKNLRHIAILFVFDIILTVALGFVAVRAYHAYSAASANKHDIYVTCVASNESRLGDVDLWDYLLARLTPAHPSLEQTAILDQVRAHVATTFAQRNCNAPAHPTSTSPTTTVGR